MISFARMNRILEIDLANERAVVQPGLVNLDLTLAVEADGYFYAPGPIQPASLHHRRQRQRKLGRPAHAGLRRHHQSRDRAGSGAGGRQRDQDQPGRMRRATI